MINYFLFIYSFKSYEKVIDVMQGRKFVINKYYKDIAFFEFDELCNRPIGNADFIAISRNCSIIFLKNVPNFSIKNRNLLRRFINMVNV